MKLPLIIGLSYAAGLRAENKIKGPNIQIKIKITKKKKINLLTFDISNPNCLFITF